MVVNYLTSKASAEAIVAHIEAQGGSAMAVQADICKQDDCKQLVDAAIACYGQVDICIVGPGAGWNAEPIDQLDPANALHDLHREVAPLYYLMPAGASGHGRTPLGADYGYWHQPRQAIASAFVQCFQSGASTDFADDRKDGLETGCDGECDWTGAGGGHRESGKGSGTV